MANVESKLIRARIEAARVDEVVRLRLACELRRLQTDLIDYTPAPSVFTPAGVEATKLYCTLMGLIDVRILRLEGKLPPEPRTPTVAESKEEP